MVNVAFSQDNFGIDNQFRPSFHAGIYGVYYLNKMIVFTPELLYSDKGYLSNSIYGSGHTTVSLGYISLPILTGYHFNKNVAVSFGPELSYLLTTNTGNESQIIYDIEFWDRKVDLGIVLGINYLIKNKIEFGARYAHGLIDVISEKVKLRDAQGILVGTGDNKSKNRVFQLSLGYRLN